MRADEAGAAGHEHALASEHLEVLVHRACAGSRAASLFTLAMTRVTSPDASSG